MKKKLTPKSCGHNSVPLDHFQSYRIILRSVDTIVYPHTNQYPTLYINVYIYTYVSMSLYDIWLPTVSLQRKLLTLCITPQRSGLSVMYNP